MARIEAVLRRYNKVNSIIEIDDIIINVCSRSVKKGNERLDLTPKEFDLLMILVQNKNTALYRETIFEKIWGEDLEFETRTLDLHIQRLRKKLGWKDKIKTVYKIRIYARGVVDEIWKKACGLYNSDDFNYFISESTYYNNAKFHKFNRH